MLQEFPYDVQLAQIVLESEHTNDTLKWVPASTLTSGLMPPGLEMDGWDLLRAYYQQADNYYPSLEETYNRLTMLVRVRRQSAYYTTRIVANVILLVIMVSDGQRLVEFVRCQCRSPQIGIAFPPLSLACAGRMRGILARHGG